MAQQTTVDTPRLLLRAATIDDANQMFEAFSDPEVMRFWSEPPHANVERTRQWLTGMAGSGQNGVTDFIICLKPASDASSSNVPTPIGKIGIYSPRPSNEIGFQLARTHWHRGYAREALSAMLEYLFNLRNDTSMKVDAENSSSYGVTSLSQSELDSEWLYPSISADTDPRNAASIGLLKKVGFVDSAYQERSFEIGGVWVDSQYLKLERDSWLARKGSEKAVIT